MAQRRQLGAGPHRAEDEAGHAVAAGPHLVGDLARQPGALLGQFPDTVRNVVVGEVGQVAAERVGLDGVGPGLEVRAVDVSQHVRAGVVEDLVAAFEPEEVVEREVRGLQHGAHGSVADDNALVQRIEQGRVKWRRHAVQTSGRANQCWP